MNRIPKVVFSRTLRKASWSNTGLAKDDIATEAQHVNKEPQKGMAILGSGGVVSQLAPEGLIDEYQVVGRMRGAGSGLAGRRYRGVCSRCFQL